MAKEKLITRIERNDIDDMIAGRSVPTNQAVLEALYQFGHEGGRGQLVTAWVQVAILDQLRQMNGLLTELKSAIAKSKG